MTTNSLNEWEVRDCDCGEWPGQKQLWHTPCDAPVSKARKSDRWVCEDCYEEPPEEIMNVIKIGKLYKGWREGEDNPDHWQWVWKPKISTSDNTISTSNFYLKNVIQFIPTIFNNE